MLRERLRDAQQQHDGRASRERFADTGARGALGPPGLQADTDLSEDAAQEVHKHAPVARSRLSQGAQGAISK